MGHKTLSTPWGQLLLRALLKGGRAISWGWSQEQALQGAVGATWVRALRRTVL